MTIFSRKEKYELHSEYGFLEIPFPGVESNLPQVTFKDDFTLEVLYTALKDGVETALKIIYRCPVIESFKDAGSLTPDDHNPKECLWLLSEQELVFKNYLIKVIVFDARGSFKRAELAVITAASVSEARKNAISLFAEGTIKILSTHKFSDSNRNILIVNSVSEINDEDAKLLKKHFN